MRSKLTLLTTAAVLAFGLSATAALAVDAPGAHGDITIVKDSTGNAPGGSAIEQNNQGGADEGAAAQDPADEGDAVQATPPAGDEGGAGANEGAAGKSTEDLGAPAATPPVKEGKLPSPSSSY